VAESRLKDTGIAFGEEEGETAARRSKDVVAGTQEVLNEAFASESALIAQC